MRRLEEWSTSVITRALIAATVVAVPLGHAVSADSHDPAAASFYPADAARGKGLAAPCIACHAAESPQPANQPFHTPKLGGQRPDSIFGALLEYQSGARRSDLMTPIASALTLKDMRDVAAYLAGPQVTPSPAKVPNSEARERVREDCAACHGETGLGIMPGYPIIGGQYADYLAYALQMFKSGARSNATMSVMARDLSEQQIQELARYFEERGYLRSVE